MQPGRCRGGGGRGDGVSKFVGGAGASSGPVIMKYNCWSQQYMRMRSINYITELYSNL